MDKRRLNALTGIKILAVFCVFLWHAPIQRVDWPDLGARCCELLFVVSGFLVAYNRFNDNDVSVRDTVHYVMRKVKAFYPVYLLGLLISIATLMLSSPPQDVFSWVTPGKIASLPVHLLISQSWISGISMSYNGAAWFLSALLVCYFVAPFIALVVRRVITRRGTGVGCVVLFLAFAFLRLLIEYGNRVAPDLFNISIHTSPIVRVLEFAMAYVVGVWFQTYASRYTTPPNSKHRVMVFSLLEIVVVGAVFAAIVLFNDVWMRGWYVVLFCGFTCLFGVGQGIISKLLSIPLLSWVARVEMEFYLLHQPIIRFVVAALAIVGIHWEKKAALLAFVVTFVLSYGLVRLRHHISCKRVSRN